MEISIKTKYNIGDKLYKLEDGKIRKYKIDSLRLFKCISEKGENVEITYYLYILKENSVIYETCCCQEEKNLDKYYFKTQEELINHLLKTAQK